MDKSKSKFDVMELKRLKKEKKKMKEKELLARLDKTKSIQASLAAKPVPKVEKSYSFEFALNQNQLVEYKIGDLTWL